MQTNIENPPSSLPQNLNFFLNEIASLPKKEYRFWCDLTMQKYSSEEELQLLDCIIQKLTADRVSNGSLASIAAWIVIKNNKDILDVMDWLLEDQGNSYAMNVIGYLFEQGIGFGQDYQQAKCWYEKGVEQGNPLAMTNLANMYEIYFKVESSKLLAVSLYKKAMPYKLAALNLGFLLVNNPSLASHITNKELGDIVNAYLKDNKPETAKSLLEIGIEKGCPEAMNTLGFMYQQGNGLLKDYAKAFELYEKAEKLRHPTAINNLAVMHYFGHGIALNLEKAVLYFRKALNLGCEKAKESLVKMKDRHHENFFVQYHCLMALDLWKELKALYDIDSIQLENYISDDFYLEQSEKSFTIMQLQNIENAVFYCRKLDNKETRVHLEKIKARNPDNFFVQYHCAVVLGLGRDLALLHQKDPIQLFEFLSSDCFLDEDTKNMLLMQSIEDQSSFSRSVEYSLANNNLSFFPQEGSEEVFNDNFIEHKFA